ncbi:histidine phosphatase family protein [Paenibacillus sp. 1011MAR3C5]|uniref:histidine phosphatase family protein n=1 Tax=Paenibacillus sp. 1011MAR3C5 TaxID=1675787 RepID=UPI000E6BB6E8|nr:histidine phosphatase family protein [Paenibacillus sp. 1011MAR3C5]RJE90927.1 histidine phosphatase family protein [Paenibacillus sp. 1011MAR3C5]
MIYVVRHGQTDWNKEGRLQGRSGLPLNETGIRQAEELKGQLASIRFDYVISSPQARAIQTAEIASGLPVQIDGRLDVFDLGEADGLRRSEVTLAGPIPDARIYKGMEDIQGFMQRVFAFMGELEARYGQSGANILLSGHRCTTGCIGAYFEGLPEDRNILRYSSDNGAYKTYAFRSSAS